MPLRLQVENLGLKYSNKWLFRGISLAIHAGQAWAIIGPNGSGKSSLLALLAGYKMPSEGKIVYEIADSAGGPGPAAYGFFWQSPHVQPPPDLTVADVVSDVLSRKGSLIQPACTLLEGLPAKAPLYTLSSGMRHRLMVGLALSMQKGFVLLDEPTAFLDHRYKAIVWEAFQAQKAYPERILVCATNDPAEAALFPQVVSLAAYAA